MGIGELLTLVSVVLLASVGAASGLSLLLWIHDDGLVDCLI